METVFSLHEADRATFLQSIMQSFHPTYICLWSSLPHPSNLGFSCLLNLDALYREDDDQSKQPSSSFGSFARSLFHDYTNSIFNLENNLVPGHASKNNISFLEVRESMLQTHSSSLIQRQFYAAAGIKSVVFMGSSHGEIELGFSEVNMVEKMKQTNPLFPAWEEVRSANALRNPLPPISSSLSPRPPSIEESPESPSLLPPSPPPSSSLSERARGSAFKKYNAMETAAGGDGRGRESLMKKWLVFYRKMRLMRSVGGRIVASRPASAQLLHMIAERRRREKLNESFAVLRSILPPHTKKDKASVLATTREHLTKLKAQVLELSHKNEMLLEEAQALHNRNYDQSTTATSSLNERLTIDISYAPPGSTAETIDLEITVKGEEGPLMADVAIRVLEFLRNIVNVRVVLSFHAHHHTAPSPLTRLAFRFNLQGGEWDGSAFLEAVRRIVSDLVPHVRENKP